MESHRMDLDEDFPLNENNNPQETRKLVVQRSIHSLVHACHCRDKNCRLSNCQKMKRVVGHPKICLRTGNCPIFKQLMALCCYHAKYCVEIECSVVFCVSIRRKMRNLQQKLQQANHPRCRRQS